MDSVTLRFVASILVALILSILPMPDFFHHIKPAWGLLLFMYVLHYVPEYFNRVTLIFVGLILDVMLASVLGEHAFALLLATWLAMSKARRFYLFTMAQQLGYLAIYSFAYFSALAVIESCLGYPTLWVTYFGSWLLTLMVWPWVRILAQDVMPMHLKYR